MILLYQNLSLFQFLADSKPEDCNAFTAQQHELVAQIINPLAAEINSETEHWQMLQFRLIPTTWLLVLQRKTISQ